MHISATSSSFRAVMRPPPSQLTQEPCGNFTSSSPAEKWSAFPLPSRVILVKLTLPRPPPPCVRSCAPPPPPYADTGTLRTPLPRHTSPFLHSYQF